MVLDCLQLRLSACDPAALKVRHSTHAIGIFDRVNPVEITAA
jgi:hypothetical protein